MFEVLYISTTFTHTKGTKEFIDRLAWDLRKHEIYGFEIDYKNMQLKTDKFIVSAVSVYGARLESSHPMAEYYIDKVSYANYPNEVVRKEAQELLKILKCGLRETTKEIFEEELIKILTEVSTHD